MVIVGKGLLLFLIGILGTGVQVIVNCYLWIRYATWDPYTLLDLVLESRRAHQLPPGWWEYPEAMVSLHGMFETLPISVWLCPIAAALCGLGTYVMDD